MLKRSTIQLLRFHFSLFLLPVYLFALSQLAIVNWRDAVIIFFVLHVLVYPSSNGYNSYMDRDETPIGGVKKPMSPSKQLFLVTIGMDIVAIAVSFTISTYFAAGVLLYILASRAYSYRGIRLKKYPVIGYLTVVLFQGALIFFISYHGSSLDKTLEVPMLPMIAASCLIGGYYPLTQIYQHEDDRKNGIRTISMLLGKRGTFVFCGGIFAAATLLMFITFYHEDRLGAFYIFLGCMLPMVLFFLIWMSKVWKNEAEANFRNSLWMNILASACTAICFLTLLILR
ncbi:MAG TPA: UbiA prenyltransferase family protein [Chitinophagaceae bacterium]|nr:UbiA prenyltransferase family protein [Chitinophagaceae bacterium]